MALLTTMGSTLAAIPLFTTVEEALNWAAGNNCSGYHTHIYQKQKGFMGCTNHQTASGMPLNSNAPPAQQTQNTPPQRNTPTQTPLRRNARTNTRVTSRSSGSSGGGGGGGY